MLLQLFKRFFFNFLFNITGNIMIFSEYGKNGEKKIPVKYFL